MVAVTFLNIDFTIGYITKNPKRTNTVDKHETIKWAYNSRKVENTCGPKQTSPYGPHLISCLLCVQKGL